MRLQLLFLTLLAASPLSAQMTRNVPAQYPTIQAAINACVNGDDVLVAPGTYPGAINFFGKAIWVHSSGGAAVTTITGTSTASVVTFVFNEGPLARLDGFTVTGGDSGVLIQNASPVIQNCSIVYNFSSLDGGAGVRCLSLGQGVASPAFTACTISHNAAAFPLGGGGFMFSCQSTSLSSPTLDGCLISSNAAGVAVSGPLDGGGAFVTGNCSLTATDCAFTNNSGGFGSGCRVVNAPSATFTRCRFSGNQVAYSGGGLSVENTNVLLDGCLVSQNSGSGSFGGLDFQLYGGPNALVRGCTIAGNTNGGARILGVSGSVIIDSVIWGNSGTDLDAASIPVAWSDVGVGVYFAGTGVISADPRFADPATGDYHLARSSPCRDTGMPGAGGLTLVDIDGTPRLVNGTIDMGADEVPLPSYPGTNEDLELYAWVNGLGDPLASARACPAGGHLRFLFRSPGGTLIGANPLMAGVLFASGSPPLPIPGFPQIWLNGNVFVILGALPPPPFSVPGLPSSGISLEYLVPPGLSGTTVRLQALVTTPFAANGMWAITNATEAVF